MSTKTARPYWSQREVLVYGKLRPRIRGDEWACDCEYGSGHPIPGEPHHGGGVHGCHFGADGRACCAPPVGWQA